MTATSAPPAVAHAGVAGIQQGLLQQGLLPPDTPVLANRTLRPDVDPAGLPVVAYDRWALSAAIFEDHAQTRSLNFALQPARLRDAAKRCVWLQLNHDAPPGLPGSAAKRLSVSSILHGFDDLVAFLHWLDARGIARVGDVTTADLDAYLRDLLAAELSHGVLADRVNEVRRLWAWRGLLPAGDRLPDAPPWQGEEADAIVGRRRRGVENRTPRIHPDTMDRLLGWALRFVEVFADDILVASREHRRLQQQSSRRRRRRGQPKAGRRRGELEHAVRGLLERLRARGEPLPGVVQADGSRTVAWEHLGRLLGCVGHGLKQRFAPMVEAAGLPIADACYLDTSVSGCVDGVPRRRLPIAYHEAELLARHLATACFVVIAHLSGMRPGENQAELHLMQHSAGST